MTHRFPLKEIARQAGLGTATVDRVLNKRAHVSPQSRARVAAAIVELEGQETLLAARGRRMFFDFVVEAPLRFSREVRQAAERAIPQIGTAVCRSRFVTQEIMGDDEAVAALRRIRKRGSAGVCLKLRDTPAIRNAVTQLGDANIPVVTLVTDIAETHRIAYVGLDNQGAGQTAAFLVSKTVGDTSGTVLATRSDDQFLGEEVRETAFLDVMQRACPRLRVVTVSGGGGRNVETAKLMSNVVDDLGELRAVYSMGGGNRSIIDVLHDAGLRPGIFIAHDLDRENNALMADGHLTFILHHDLQKDLHRIFQTFLSHHRLAPQHLEPTLSEVQVVTPYNLLPPTKR